MILAVLRIQYLKIPLGIIQAIQIIFFLSNKVKNNIFKCLESIQTFSSGIIKTCQAFTLRWVQLFEYFVQWTFWQWLKRFIGAKLDIIWNHVLESGNNNGMRENLLFTIFILQSCCPICNILKQSVIEYKIEEVFTFVHVQFKSMMFSVFWTMNSVEINL